MLEGKIPRDLRVRPEAFLDAVATGTPVVTWAGPSHRGRWAAAINRRLGQGELVAEQLIEYPALAIRIASESENVRRAAIAAAGAELFANPAAIREWEDYFVGRVAMARA